MKIVNILTGVFYTRRAGEWLEIQTLISKIVLDMASLASVIYVHAYGWVMLLLQVWTKNKFNHMANQLKIFLQQQRSWICKINFKSNLCYGNNFLKERLKSYK